MTTTENLAPLAVAIDAIYGHLDAIVSNPDIPDKEILNSLIDLRNTLTASIKALEA